MILGTTIENCKFTGIEFDKGVVGSVQTIAEALLENAKALGKLSGLFHASNVHIDSLLTVSPGPETDNPETEAGGNP